MKNLIVVFLTILSIAFMVFIAYGIIHYPKVVICVIFFTVIGTLAIVGLFLAFKRIFNLWKDYVDKKF